MKKYGLILADNGWDKDSRKWWFYGVRDERWDGADLWKLSSVKGTDFEAVDVSSLMIDPDSGKARITETVTLAPTLTPAPTPTPAPYAQPANGIPVIVIPIVCIGILTVCCFVGFLEK
jgi:hypothetical protein